MVFKKNVTKILWMNEIVQEFLSFCKITLVFSYDCIKTQKKKKDIFLFPLPQKDGFTNGLIWGMLISMTITHLKQVFVLGSKMQNFVPWRVTTV